MPEAFDAYHKWLAIPPHEQPPNHYRLLGITALESDQDVIAGAADKQMAHVKTFQSGPHSAASQRILSQISAARNCLLDAVKKAEYDGRLQNQLGLSDRLPLPANDFHASQLGISLSSLHMPALAKPRSHTHVTKRPWWHFAALGAGSLVAVAILAYLFIPKSPVAITPEGPAMQAKAGAESKPTEPPPSLAEPPAHEPRQVTVERPIVPIPAEPDKPQPVIEPEPKPEPAAESPEIIAKRVQETFALAKSAADYRAVSIDALKLIEQANAAGKPDIAKSEATLALTAARKAGDDELAKTATLCVLDPAASPTLSAESRADRTDRADKADRNDKVYLDDLDEFDVSLGYGTLGKRGGGADPGSPCSVLGKVPEHSLLPHPPPDGVSSVSYRLDAGFSRFQSKVAISDERQLATPLTFRLRGDGRLLWESRPQSQDKTNQACDVSVAGVKVLTFEVSCPGPNFGAWGVWVEPFLVKETAHAADQPVANASSWVEILPRVNVERDRVLGDWAMRDGELSTTAAIQASRIMLPVKVEGEYDLKMTFTVHPASGHRDVAVILPVGPKSCALKLGGWNGSVYCLDSVDGRRGDNNVTTIHAAPLATERQYTLSVEVREQGEIATIQASLDDKPLLRWQGKTASLSPDSDDELPQPNRPGVSLWDCLTTVHSVQLRMVSGKATWTDDSAPLVPVVESSTSQVRPSVPDAVAQLHALTVVHDVFKSEYASATTAPKQKALAEELLHRAQETNDDMPARYVMLKEAGGLALKAKAADLAFQIIDEMAAGFNVDAFAVKVKALASIGKLGLAQQDCSAVVNKVLALMDEAVAKEQYDTAKQLGTIAADFVRRSKDTALNKQTVARKTMILQQIAEIQKAQEKTDAALAALDKNAIDPAANLAVGKFRCFVQGKWDQGVPLLALGDDPVLKDLAVKELKGPADAAGQASLGDAWWDLCDKKAALEKKNVQEHAACCYQQALPGLTGLMKEKADQRLRDWESARAEQPQAEARKQVSRFKQQPSLKVKVVDYNERLFNVCFPPANNLARAGKIACSSTQGGSPENVFRGSRTGEAWWMSSKSKGQFAATWDRPPRGRYLIFFARTGGFGKGSDAWGTASLTVNEGTQVSIPGMSGTMVAVVDLGAPISIRSAVVDMSGGNWGPGLAGIEIHEIMIDPRTGMKVR